MEKIKKYFPFIVLGLGVLLLVVMVVSRRGGEPEVPVADEGPELPFSQRPYTSLTPTPDGHYLNLVVDNIAVPGAASMEYELYYSTADGINQGVTGIARFTGANNTRYENELLLGSESAGKFRYDQGVNQGTLTLRFRDKDGKTIGRTAGQWHLLSGTDSLTSLDGAFSYNLDETSEDYFIVMPAFGLPGEVPFEIGAGPYGVFGSGDGPYSGIVEISGSAYLWDGNDWKDIKTTSEDIGVFVSSK